MLLPRAFHKMIGYFSHGDFWVSKESCIRQFNICSVVKPTQRQLIWKKRSMSKAVKFN